MLIYERNFHRKKSDLFLNQGLRKSCSPLNVSNIGMDGHLKLQSSFATNKSSTKQTTYHHSTILIDIDNCFTLKILFKPPSLVFEMTKDLFQEKSAHLVRREEGHNIWRDCEPDVRGRPAYLRPGALHQHALVLPSADHCRHLHALPGNQSF